MISKEEQNKVLKELLENFDWTKFNSEGKTKLVGENHNLEVTIRSIVKDKKIHDFVHERIKTAQNDPEFKELMSQRNKEILENSFGVSDANNGGDAKYAGEDVLVFTLFTAEWFKWRSKRLLEKLKEESQVENVRKELLNKERQLTTSLMVAQADNKIFSDCETSELIAQIKEDTLPSDKCLLTKFIENLQNEFNHILCYKPEMLYQHLKYLSDKSNDYMKRVYIYYAKYAELIEVDNAKQFSKEMNDLNRLRELTMVYYIKNAIEKKVPIIGYGDHHVKAIELSGIFEPEINAGKLVIYEDMKSFLENYQQEAEPDMDEV